MEARRTSTIMGTKPKTHITDPTQDAPEGASWTLCGLFVLSKQVDDAHPSCQKCLRFRHSKRWKGRLVATKSR